MATAQFTRCQKCNEVLFTYESKCSGTCTNCSKSTPNKALCACGEFGLYNFNGRRWCEPCAKDEIWGRK